MVWFALSVLVFVTIACVIWYISGPALGELPQKFRIIILLILFVGFVAYVLTSLGAIGPGWVGR